MSLLRICSLLIFCLLAGDAYGQFSRSGARVSSGQRTENAPQPAGETTYADLQAATCSPSETMSVTSPTYHSGEFTCTAEANVPRPNSGGNGWDDGGVQLASATAGNYWVRTNYNTSSDPIELSWFDWMANGVRIDTLLGNWMDAGNKDLFWKAPVGTSGVDSVTTDTLDFNSGSRSISQFYFYESDHAVEIAQLPYGTVADSIEVWSIEDVDSVFIGSTTSFKTSGQALLTFTGRHFGANCSYPLSAGERCSRGGAGSGTGTLSRRGLLDVNMPGGAKLDYFVFRANMLDSPAFGVRLCTSSCDGGVGYVELGGKFTNSAPKLGSNSGTDEMVLDSTIVEDVHGVQQGYQGTSYPNNVDCNTQDSDNAEKTRRVEMDDVAKVTGVLHLRYGAARWFFQGDVDTVGVSLAEPLHIYYDSLGYLGPNSHVEGRRLDDNGCLNPGGKLDPWPANLASDYTTRFMKVEQLHPTVVSSGYGVVIESTGQGGKGGSQWGNIEIDGLNWDTQTITYEITTDGAGGDDATDFYIRVSGDDITGNIRIGRDFTVDGQGTGTAEDIIVRSEDEGCTDNTIKDITLTGTIDINNECVASSVQTVDNVTFSGTSREVINIATTEQVTVPSDGKLTAASGSTIDGAGTLVCSGNTQSLPYTFDGTTDDCEQ